MPVILTRNHKPSSRSENSILVVPTKRRIRHLSREFLIKSGPVSEPRIFTLELLAQRIVEKAFESLRLIEEPVITLLFSQAILNSSESLNYFNLRGAHLRLPRGTLEKVVHVIRKLKEVGIYPELLADEIDGAEEDEKTKLRDIVSIYDEYEKILAGISGIDAEGMFKAFHVQSSQEKFELAFRESFPDVEEVFIVGFDEFTQPELSFIRKIVSMNFSVTVIFDFQPGNSDLFGHLEQNYDEFKQLGFCPADILPGENGPTEFRGVPVWHVQSTKAAVHIGRNLFKKNPGSKVDCSKHITIAMTKDRVAEIELICKLIKEIISQNPAKDLSRICVAMHHPQTYTRIIREQFSKFGIPANVTDRFELAEAPPVVSLVGLLEVVVRRFRRGDVMRATTSCYFEFMNDGRPVDAANLATISLNLRIVQGIGAWQTKIDKQIERIQRDALSVENEEDGKRYARDQRRLQKAKSDIQWLDQILRNISGEQNPRDFKKHVHELIERLEFPRRIVSGSDMEVIEKDARAYAKFLETLEQTVQLIEFQNEPKTKHSLRFYVDQLKVALSQQRYNVREQFGQGVLVTSIEETRGLPLDIMIVAGLVDGEFPSVYQSEIFLSSKRLKEREQHHSWENRYLFYQAITNWSEHLYLTYPEQDSDLDLVRSNFVDAVRKIADVEEWKYPGATPFETTIYSAQDFLVHYGSSLRRMAAETPAIPSALIKQTEHVAHAVNIERSRVDLNDLPEYSGEIFNSISAEGREQLQQLKHRVYSVSQLEAYGMCPYKFFVQRLLGLNALDDLEEEFSPLEKGSVLHDILFEFYTIRRDKKMRALVGCNDVEFNDALKLLLEIAERKLGEIDIPDAYWELEKELILGGAQSGILTEFLQYERARTTTLQPKYFEVGFGSDLGRQTRIDKTLSSEDPIMAGTVQLRAKIDRVDITDGSFAVIDYKSGIKLPTIQDIRMGISVQLPLYLYTVEKLLAQVGYTVTPAAGVYYQIRRPVAFKVGIGSARFKNELEMTRAGGNMLPSDEDLRQLIDESIRIVNGYVENITKGKFPLADVSKIEKVCAYCDYKTICRIQTIHQVNKP